MAIVSVAALVAGALVLFALWPQAPTRPPPGQAMDGSTLQSTWRDRDGDGVLEQAPGEALRDRTELGPAGRPGRVLATLAQITDAHVRDEESPGRLPVLDRFGSPFTDSFRPQEALTPHVLAGAVAAINRLRPDAVAVTGDLADSAQTNELDQSAAVLEGGVVRPDTGRTGYDGVQEASNPDPFFYRPGVDAPRHPGIAEQAQRAFRSPGLRAPWFPAAGNHDLLTAGVVAPTDRIAAAATGSRQITEIDEDVEVPRSSASISPELVDRLLGGGLGETAYTPPDEQRRPLSAAQAIARLRKASAAPPGGERLDYGFDVGPAVRGMVLDGTRRDSGSGGRYDAQTLSFVRRELAQAGDRHVVVFSHHPLRRSEGGQAVLEALAADERVVAAVSGHAHRNAITPFGRGGEGAGRGPWLIETASLADYPQQARALRLRETDGGGVVLETWMLDHTGGPLAATSRELAHFDSQGGRPRGSRGGWLDRNVRLGVPRGDRTGPSR